MSKEDLIMKANKHTTKIVKSGNFHWNCGGEGCSGCNWTGEDKNMKKKNIIWIVIAFVFYVAVLIFGFLVVGWRL